MRTLRKNRDKQYITYNAYEKPRYGSVYQHLRYLNDKDDEQISTQKWKLNDKEIRDLEMASNNDSNFAVLMPEVTVHAGLSPKLVLHKSDDYVDRALQRSFDIVADNPDVYGKRTSKIIGTLSPSRFRKSWPEMIYLPKFLGNNVDGATWPFVIGYANRILGDTDLLNTVRAHEFNHALWNHNLMLHKKDRKKIRDIIYDAYLPNIRNKDAHALDIAELIASNADIRNYIAESGEDYNKYNFLDWEKGLWPGFSSTLEDGTTYRAHVHLPELTGYIPLIANDIRYYANGRYRQLIHERGEDHADEIIQEITDDVNQRIRKALSTVAYNQSLNNDSPLYAKSGGILSKNRLLPRRRFNNF